MGFALCALVIMFLFQTFKMGERERPFRLRPELSNGRTNCGAQAFEIFFAVSRHVGRIRGWKSVETTHTAAVRG